MSVMAVWLISRNLPLTTLIALIDSNLRGVGQRQRTSHIVLDPVWAGRRPETPQPPPQDLGLESGYHGPDFSPTLLHQDNFELNCQVSHWFDY